MLPGNVINHRLTYDSKRHWNADKFDVTKIILSSNVFCSNIKCIHVCNRAGPQVLTTLMVILSLKFVS